MYCAYPAVFYPEEDGRYSVIFPDLNDLATFGDDLADALAMAQEACGQYLFAALKDGEKLPTPTRINDVAKDEEDAFVNMIGVNLDEYAKIYGDKAVRKTLSIPAWMDAYVEKNGISCSRVLQDAILASMQKAAMV